MKARAFLVFWLTVSVALPPTPVRGQVDSDPPAGKFALLIGCSVYPELPEKLQLRGPANDIALTSSLLKERYQFGDDQIVTMTHDSAAPLRPTYDHIVREYEALIERVNAGNSVFLMIAGHGSQMKDDNGDEPDGRDEVFLPEDVYGWKYGKPIPRAIRDDQFRTWIDALRAKGAMVFFLADTCHSGTMDRGAAENSDLVRDRYVDPQVLGPEETPAAHSVGGAEAPEAGAPVGLAEVSEVAEQPRGGLIALYAVDDKTQEKEQPMPPEGPTDGPWYGRLAWTFNWVVSRSRRELTYEELAQQIAWRYQSWGWENVGFIMGSAKEYDREVLGEGLWVGRSDVTLERDPEYGLLSINAGSLDGVTVGSVYAVYPPVGQENDDRPAGCVRVVEATPTAARVEPCAYEDVTELAPEALPAPGRCELRFAAAGSMKLSVGVAAHDPNADGSDVAAAMQTLQALAGMPNSLLQPAADGVAPSAYLVVHAGNAYLRRAAERGEGFEGTPGSDARFPAAAFGPFALRADADSPLALALERMAKATNIRRLATSDAEAVPGAPTDSALELTVVVERLNPATGAYESVDLSQQLDVRDKDALRVSVTNERREPVDVTILYIDNAFNIYSFFPFMRDVEAGDFANRIDQRSGPAVANFKVTNQTLGLEDVIIIATLPTPGAPYQHFAHLEQRSLERGADAGSGVRSPVGQLLSLAAFGSGERGGSSAQDIARYAIHRVSWNVLP